MTFPAPRCRGAGATLPLASCTALCYSYERMNDSTRLPNPMPSGGTTSAAVPPSGAGGLPSSGRSSRAGGGSSSGRGDETRTALLAAGRAAFARKGYDGASIRDITREAGANLGAVTYHFGSKRALYASVLVEGLTPLVDRVGQAAAAPGPSTERLGKVVEAFMDHIGANPDLPRLLLQEIAAGKKPPVELVALVRRNLGHLTAILSQGHADGSLRRAHPALSALSVVALPIYLTLVAPMIREVAGLDIHDAAFRAQALDHVQTFVEAGLAAPQETVG